jgi:hypothetical protein
MLSDVILQLCAANIQRAKGTLVPTTETTGSACTIATLLTLHRCVNSFPLPSPRQQPLQSVSTVAEQNIPNNAEDHCSYMPYKLATSLVWA